MRFVESKSNAQVMTLITPSLPETELDFLDPHLGLALERLDAGEDRRSLVGESSLARDADSRRIGTSVCDSEVRRKNQNPHDSRKASPLKG